MWGAMPAMGQVLDIYAPSVDEFWVIRRSEVLYLKNNTWNFMTSVPAGTKHVTGTGPNDVWLSGGGGVVQQWDGARHVTHFLGSSDETGLVHVTATQTWVPTTGTTTRSYRRTTSGWQEAPGAWRVGGFGDEVYLLAGRKPSLLQWTSGQQTSLVSNDMRPYFITATSDAVYAVKSRYLNDGSSNQLVRVRSGVVTTLDTGTTEDLLTLAATPDGHVWATTAGGGLLHKRPSAGSPPTRWRRRSRRTPIAGARWWRPRSSRSPARLFSLCSGNGFERGIEREGVPPALWLRPTRRSHRRTSQAYSVSCRAS
jgi:hypothetical protein